MFAVIDPGTVVLVTGAVATLITTTAGAIVLVIKALRNQPTNPPAS